MLKLFPIQKIYLFILFFIICWFTYVASLSNPFFADDYNFLSGMYNYKFESFADLFSKSESQHFIPLYYLTNMILFDLFPEHPFVLRVINLLLFSVDCFLWYQFLLLLTNDRRLSFTALFLFCIHPINADIVNWITKNYVFIYSIALKLSFIFFWTRPSSGPRRTRHYLLSLFFYLISLLCFEAALLYPLFLASGLFFLKKHDIKTIGRQCRPFLVMAVIYLVFYIIVAGENSSLFMKINMLSLSFPEYTATIARLIFWYLRCFFIPDSIVSIKNIPPVTEHLLLWNILFGSLLLALVLLLVRRGKGLFSFSVVWFLIGFVLFLPACFSHAYMGLVIEPHWFYFSSMGFFLLLALGFKTATSRLSQVAAFLILMSLGFYLFAWTQFYHHIARAESTYCQFWLSQSPKNQIPLFRLGVLAQTPNEAKSYFEKNLSYGDYQIEKTYNNLAFIAFNEGDTTRARAYVQEAIKLNPQYASAHNLLGTIHMRQQSYAAGEKAFLLALELNPPEHLAFHNLLDLYLLTQQYKKGTELYKEYQRLHLPLPERKEALSKLAVIFYRVGDIDQSLELLEEIFEYQPQADDYINVSLLFSRMNLDPVAFDIIKQAHNRYPDHKEIYLLSGVYLVNQKKYRLALGYWKKGQQIDPTDQRFEKYIQDTQRLLTKEEEDDKRPK